MPEWFQDMQPVEQVFAVCAALGSIVFVIRTALLVIGGLDNDLDGGDHDDFDIGDAAEQAADADASFRILSVQGLTAFVMMFGYVGLALSRGSGLDSGWAVAGGLAAGFGSASVIGWLFSLFMRLQHSGTINLERAIGGEGTVYLTIPKGETGKVRVTVQGHLKVYDAISEDESEIPSDARIKVVKVVSGNVLVVKSL